MLSQILINGLVTACVYGLVALGFSLIYNVTGVFHFAHGCVYTVSAYLLYVFLIILQWHLSLSIAFMLIFISLFGLLIEKFIYSPLYQKKASPYVVFISSIGTYIFAINIISILFRNRLQFLRTGMEITYNIGNIILTKIQFAIIILSPLLFFSFILFMRKTRMGQSFRAVSNNPALAVTLGINIPQVRIMALVIGSILAAIGASFKALDLGIDPYIGMPMMFTVISATIIGGKDVIEASILGSFLISFIQSLIIWQFSARWEQAVTSIILVLFLVFRPQGILGLKKRTEEI